MANGTIRRLQLEGASSVNQAVLSLYLCTPPNLVEDTLVDAA